MEVVRALAEEAGELGEIARRSLPQQLFVGGVEQVLARRLQRVPDAARGLLRLAAVMGRQLDLEVLATLYPERDELIQLCAESGVLDMHEQRWRFSHDKLRERLLAKLSPEDERSLHATIAQAIEQTYQGGALPAAQLARHYHQAQQSAKAIHYYALGGAAALARGAPAEAAVLLEHAVALQQDVQVPLLTRVQVWRRLAQARYGLGELSSTDQALRQVCALVGWPLPTSSWELTRTLLRQGVEHLLSFMRSSAALSHPMSHAGDPAHEEVGDPQQERELHKELHRELLLALMVQEIYVWKSQPGLTLLGSMRGFQLAEELNAAPQRTYFRAAIAFLLSFTPLGGLGLRYLEHEPASAGTVAEIDSLRTRAIVELHRGNLDRATANAAHAVKLAREQRDDFALMSSLLQQELSLVEQEDFPQVLVVCREMERLAAVAQNPRYMIVAMMGQLGAHVRSGRYEQAEEVFARTGAHHSREVGAVPESVLFGLAAVSALRLGDRQGARQRADRSLDAVLRARWPLLQLRYALIGILEVYLDPDRPDGEKASALAPASERTDQALRSLRLNALQFASMRAISALYHARHTMLCGHTARAQRQLEHSVRVADKYSRRFDQAVARYWLGRLLKSQPAGSRSQVQADGQLREALALFASVGASWEAEQARRLLGPHRA